MSARMQTQWLPGWKASRQSMEADVVQRLTNDVDMLDAQKLCSSRCSDDKQNSTGARSDQLLRTLSEDVQKQLHRVLQVIKELTAEKEDRAARATHIPTEDAVELLEQFVSADLPVQLLTELPLLGFEARKDVMNVCSALLWKGMPQDIHDRIIDYLRRDTRIFPLLVAGYANDEAGLQCGVVLRSCLRHKELVEAFLASGQVFNLIRHTKNRSFDIASDAFYSLREAMMEHKEVSAVWLHENCSEFFSLFNDLLESDNYLLQRQASSLLASMLVDRHFSKVMVPYVSDVANLRITMNLLRNPSKTIQIEAFNVLKLFVANPRKPLRVWQILFNNKERLVDLLACLEALKHDDKSFEKERRTVIDRLNALSPPVREARADVMANVATVHDSRPRMIMAL